MLASLNLKHAKSEFVRQGLHASLDLKSLNASVMRTEQRFTVIAAQDHV